jgi:hypothetical protein
MSSNDLETMSQPHILNGDSHIDVSNHIPPAISPSLTAHFSPTDYAVDPIQVSRGEISKSVRAGGTKRRKVSLETTSIPPGGRKTRFGNGTAQVRNKTKPVGPKQKTAQELKDATRSGHKKRLQQTYEAHDSKVRELFHLTKFVSLVDYDAKTAKQDESEVFREVIPIQLKVADF